MIHRPPKALRVGDSFADMQEVPEIERQGRCAMIPTQPLFAVVQSVAYTPAR